MVVPNDIDDIGDLDSLDGDVPKYDDLKVICCDCDKAFIFTAGEQLYYRTKDLAPPKRCTKCRRWKRFRYDNQGLKGDAGNSTAGRNGT